MLTTTTAVMCTIRVPFSAPEFMPQMTAPLTSVTPLNGPSIHA